MKKILITLIALMLAGCANRAGPESKVLAYLKAEAIGDMTTMQNLVEPGQNPSPNWLVAQVGPHVLSVDLKKITTVTTALERDRVRVHVSGHVNYTFDNPVDIQPLPENITVPLPVDRSFTLIKLDGTWYIQPEKGNEK